MHYQPTMEHLLMPAPDDPPLRPYPHKYTVMLSSKALAVLGEAAQDNGETRTSVVNRALVLYRLITRHMAEGKTVVVRDAKGGEQTITLL